MSTKGATVTRSGMPLDKQADIEYLISKQDQTAADMDFLAMLCGVTLEQDPAGSFDGEEDD